MATIRLDPSLRKLADGRPTFKAPGNNLREILQTLGQKYPELKSALFDSSDNLENFVLIYVNGEDVRYGNGLDTEASNESDILVIKAVAGG